MSEVLPPPLPKAPRKWLWALAAVVALAVVVVMAFQVLSLGLHDSLRNKWRREWKTAAVASIEQRTSDRAWVEKEIATVKAKLESEGEDGGGWFNDQLLLMKDGSWMAYAGKCRKEDLRIRDIFICRASDGRWYYSTYHFCIGMLALRVDDRSESLAKFITAYSLREFDGRSDECLKQTWPNPTP